MYRRHQERGQILLVENARLGQDLETERVNLADINEHLTGELRASSAKMDELEAKAVALQCEVDELKESHMVSPCYDPASLVWSAAGFASSDRVF